MLDDPYPSPDCDVEGPDGGAGAHPNSGHCTCEGLGGSAKGDVGSKSLEVGEAGPCQKVSDQLHVETQASGSCGRAVATPARAVAQIPGTPDESVETLSYTPTSVATPTPPYESVPDSKDKDAARPVPGQLRISEGAIYGRLRRVFEPSKKTGHRKVSDAIYKQWVDKGKGRQKIFSLFQSCGYCKDRCVSFPNMKQPNPLQLRDCG